MGLVQLEEAVYEEHDLFTPPDNPDGRIWRYLDFAKYVSLLEHQALFFATVEALDDPFEGINQGLELIADLVREGKTREVAPDRCSELAYLVITDDARLAGQCDEDLLIDSADDLQVGKPVHTGIWHGYKSWPTSVGRLPLRVAL